MIYIYIVCGLSLIISIYEHIIYIRSKREIEEYTAIVIEDVILTRDEFPNLHYCIVEVVVDGISHIVHLNDFQSTDPFRIGDKVVVYIHNKNHKKLKVLHENGLIRGYLFSFAWKLLIIVGVVIYIW